MALATAVSAKTQIVEDEAEDFGPQLIHKLEVSVGYLSFKKQSRCTVLSKMVGLFNKF